MTGIIDIGGGLRGIFGTGVFDRLLDDGTDFDYYIGVSAGAANIASFLGQQKGRNFLFYTEYALRPEYMSFRSFIRNGSYLNLDYVYGTLSDSDGENPLDYDRMQSSDKQFFTVTTDAATGKALYYPKRYYFRDDYTLLKASCCLPVACRPVVFDGKLCFDGGISDPIPIKKAFDDGCDKVVLIITRPADELHNPSLDKKAAVLTRKKYPAISEALDSRYQLYNDSLALAREYERLGKALIIAPDDCKGLKTLTKDKDKLKRLYDDGYQKAEKIKEFIR